MSEDLQANLLEANLLETKFYRPRIPGRLVDRAPLLRLLDRGLSRPLTLISAPAGYGKTTLVYQWLEQVDRPAAWLSLDEYDDNLGTFVSYLLAALRTIFPHIGEQTERLLGANELPGPHRLADSLLRDLQELPEPAILTTDDYNAITDAATHAFMARFVDRLPANLHLVLITRSDPPLPLARWRGRGLVQEFRADRLRFSREDTAVFLQSVLEQPATSEVVAMLEARTEGWPAGLQFAAIALRTDRDPDGFVRRFAASNNRLLMDYVVNEVLEKISRTDRGVLLRMSVLDRFSAPLLAAVLSTELNERGGQQLLENLWLSNVFLIALDDSGTWYRYHHLFRDLLRQRLNQSASADEIRDLSTRASLWFEEQGLIEEALNYALRVENAELAARLVESHVHEALNDEDWRRLERWLLLLPEQVRRRPGILAGQIALEQFRYNIRAFAPLLAEAETGLAEGDFGYTPLQKQEWQAFLDAYRATVFDPEVDPEQAAFLAGRAVKHLPAQAHFVTSIAMLWQILATQMSGALQAAADLARLYLQRPDLPKVAANRLFLALSGVYYDEADVPNTSIVARLYRQHALRTKQIISQGWSAFLVGWVYYQNNELVEAEQHFAEVGENLHVVHVRAAVDSLTGLVLIQKAQKREEEARSTLARLRAYLVESEAIALLPVVETLAWRLGLSDQTVRPTTLALTREKIRIQLAADLWELPVLTMIRADIESGAPERIAAAQKALRESDVFATARHATRIKLRLDALRSQLLLVQGRPEEALDYLRKTVLLAETGGALREILDMSPFLYPQLQVLQDQGVAVDYLQRILAGYEQQELPAPAQLHGADEAMASILTYREVEVLLLVEQRLSNQQIAQKLYLSPHTVKKHTVNIYRKLEVKNRREAVIRARVMGILPQG